MSISSCDQVQPAGLTSFDQAVEHLSNAASVVTEVEQVAIKQALGRVLASDLVSEINVPPLSNSEMDGYAVAAADVTESGISLPVSQRICAGEVGQPLEAGTVARIFTGAPIPPNADSIIMQEVCERSGDQVVVNDEVTKGQNVRLAGEDIASGEKIIKAGTYLRAQELGLSASIGTSTLTVFKRIKVALFFTGDELVEVGKKLKPGQIYDSNRYSLLGQLETLGCDVIDLGIVPDDLESTKKALQEAASQADLVITSGGVSVGEEDHVRNALQALGELNMWRIAMKPGKPLAFGNLNGTPFLGLPGNPVSTFVTFSLVVSPFIKKMQGRSHTSPHAMKVKANFDWLKPGVRQEFLRSKLVYDEQGGMSVEIYSHQGSGVLSSTSWSDGLVSIPIGAQVNKGDMVDYYSYLETL